MPHADMPERVEHAFVGDDAVAERELAAGFEKRCGHWRFLYRYCGATNYCPAL